MTNLLAGVLVALSVITQTNETNEIIYKPTLIKKALPDEAALMGIPVGSDFWVDCAERKKEVKKFLLVGVVTSSWLQEEITTDTSVVNYRETKKTNQTFLLEFK